MITQKTNFMIIYSLLCSTFNKVTKNIHLTIKVLTNQILRSGTSIGANIHEANYAQSKADFINKMQIALKECHETEYWLKLFSKTKIITEDTYKKLSGDSGKIRRILIASLNTAKGNLDK